MQVAEKISKRSTVAESGRDVKPGYRASTGFI
jgi:hypothetical protein